MRIGRKLALTHGLMSLLFVGLVFGAKLVIDRIDRDFDTISEQTLSVITELNNQSLAGLHIVHSANEYALLIDHHVATASPSETTIIDRSFPEEATHAAEIEEGTR
jgi:hypothetical protein